MSPAQSWTGTEQGRPRPWWTQHSDAELVALATEYPYPTPDGSYIFVRGQAFELVDWTEDPLRDGRARTSGGETNSVGKLLATLGISRTSPLNERTPVLAYGSNAAPLQLARKFRHISQAVIPVLRADVDDIDVVYSAHISRYGAIPATLTASSGTTLHTFVTWLSDAELAVMHASELGQPKPVPVPGNPVPGNYVFGELQGVAISSDVVLDDRPVYAYLSRFGALGLRERPLALAAVTATRRAFTPLAKMDVLESVRDLLAPAQDVETFILSAIRGDAARQEWSRLLREAAHPVSLDGFIEQPNS